MQASKLTIVESLTAQLLVFPALVDLLKNKDNSFLDSLEKWMKETEDILMKHNLPQCSALSGIRGKIISASLENESKLSKRKRQIKVASECIYDIQEIVLQIVHPIKDKIDECRDLLNHLLSILKQSGVIKYAPGMLFQDFIVSLWSVMTSHEQLKPTSTKILSLISAIDAQRILAEEVEPSEWI